MKTKAKQTLYSMRMKETLLVRVELVVLACLLAFIEKIVESFKK